MLVLFALVVMRISGAIGFNPVFSRSNYPSRARAALVFCLSLLIYLQTGDLTYQPASLLEFGVMLLKELMVGFALGFVVELAFLVVRFATAVIDHSMGLSMAQVYDPQTQSQVTVTTNIYNAFLTLLFFATDGHVWLIRLFCQSAEIIPFGVVNIRLELYQQIVQMFIDSIVMGLQLAFPIMAMELVTEMAIGILMRMIPQINIFVVNFQLKIAVGLLMLVYLFSPMSDKLYVILKDMYQNLEKILFLMR